MDLILHKRLLALQEENAILKKQIENLQELSQKRKLDYINAAANNLEQQTRSVQQDLNDSDLAHMAGKPEQAKASAATALRSFYKAQNRKEGIARATRLLARDSQEKPSTTNSHYVKTMRKLGDSVTYSNGKTGTSSVHQTLHNHGGQQYVVSSNDDETLIFPYHEKTGMHMIEVGSGDRPTRAHRDGTIHDHHMKTFDDFIKDKEEEEGK